MITLIHNIYVNKIIKYFKLYNRLYLLILLLLEELVKNKGKVTKLKII